MLKRVGVLAASVLVIGAASVATLAADTVTARFDNLKALAGDWTMSGGDGTVAVTYRVTAGGSAVVVSAASAATDAAAMTRPAAAQPPIRFTIGLLLGIRSRCIPEA